MIVVTAAEMRAADAQAAASVGAVTLMRNAGAALAQSIARLGGGRVAAFAGPGNNGGDAFAAAAELARAGIRCTIYADDAPEPSEARLDAQTRARSVGITVKPLPADAQTATAALEGVQIVLDALLGTGSRLPVPTRYEAVLDAIARSGVLVVAADVPTGVDASTGAVGQHAIRAAHTVTFGAMKSGLLLEPARSHAGEIHVADIGIGSDELASHAHTFAALDDRSFCELLPTRPEQADKRSSGAPLIIAGSAQFPGAAVLCARAAARAGAGYVTLVAPQGAAAALRAHLLEQVVVTIDPQRPAEETIEAILDLSKRNGSIGIGPGMALDDWTGQVVRGVLQRTELPVVADASALFHLAKSLDALRAKPLVVTPHAGEFARLSGKGTIAAGTRVERIREFVDRTHITTLLKGNATLVYAGSIVHINPTGSNALATAGTGDVLTGVIATLLSQGLSCVDAARAGAYWHGLAGQCAQRARRRGVVAGDVIEALGDALPDECA